MNWFRRRQVEADSLVEPLDLEQVLRQGLRDKPAARTAIASLDRERQALERQQKVVDRQFNRLTPGKLKRIAWSNSGNPQIETNMLTDAMRPADAGRQMDRSNQLAAIDNRLQAIEKVRQELNRFLKRPG